MKSILCGYGEIGKGVYDVFGKHHDILIYDIKENKKPKGKFDVLLIAFPYTENFINLVMQYQKDYCPKVTIIFSTVQVGTTSQIVNAVHCPIEGKHPRLAESINKWQFTIGGLNKIAYKFFVEANKFPVVVEKPEYTELAKLQSTSLYGVMLEYARYVNKICEKYNIPYEYINFYNSCYNGLYDSLGMKQYQRYILTPPKGNIGGHCVVPNAKLLDKICPSIFLKEIYKDKEENL